MKVKSSLLRVRKLNALKDGIHCTRYPSKIFFAFYNACPWIEPIFPQPRGEQLVLQKWNGNKSRVFLK